MQGVKIPGGSTMNAFGWLSTGTGEIAVLISDTCDCYPALDVQLDEVVASLELEDVCALSQEALLSKAPFEVLRWKHADTRLAIFGCKEHQQRDVIDAFEVRYTPLVLDASKPNAFVKHVASALSYAEQTIAVTSASRALPPASNPESRSFIDWGAEPVPIAAEEPVFVAPSFAFEPTTAPGSSKAPPSAVATPPMVAADPASSPSKSYFVRDATGSQFGDDGNFFTPAKRSPLSALKIPFLLLFLGLLGFWGYTSLFSDGEDDAQAGMTARNAQTDPVDRRVESPSPRRAEKPRHRPAARKKLEKKIKRTKPPTRVQSRAKVPVRRVVARKRVAPVRRVVQPRPKATIEPKVNVGWIGGRCRSASDCVFPLAMCLPTRSGGFCTRQCGKLCPDRGGSKDTVSYCVDSPLVRSQGKISLGLCLAACDFALFPKVGCRRGLRCRKLIWRRKEGQRKSVCVPVVR